MRTFDRSQTASKTVAGLAIGLFLAIPLAALSAEPENLTVERVEYKGWKNNLRLDNGKVELIVTLDVGPRIISYRLKNGRNVLKEYDDQLGKAGESEWMIRGGHRLWASPEDPNRTYTLDNEPVQAETLGDGHIRVWGPVDSAGFQKELEIRLDTEGSGVTVTHRLRNAGKEPTEVAPWALTVMAPGGVEFIPLPEKEPHPEDATKATAEEFAPRGSLILWSYFDFADDRWTFGHKYITLRQKDRGPTKLGLSHRKGWAAYLNDGTLFVKRFPYHDGQTYPDRGASYETFTNSDMLEMETLGPLVRLAPGEATEHVETWLLVDGLGSIDSEEQIDQVIRPIAEGK